MSGLIVAIISVMIALLSAFGVLTVNGGGWIAAIPTFVATFLIAWFVAQLTVITPMSMWKEQRARVKVYERANLNFYYDDANDSCKRDMYLGDGQLGERLWRVGIKGSEGNLTKGVVVQVEVHDAGIPDSRHVLHPKKSPWTGLTNGWDGDGSFDI